MSVVTLCEALRSLVRDDRISDGPNIELREDAKTSKCGPVLVRHRGPCWAMRLSCDDHLRFLADRPGVKNLPDYLLFADPPRDTPNVSIRVLVGELKSSETGAKSGELQVQRGKLLAEYLVGIARMYMGMKDDRNAPKPWCTAVILSPDLPANLIPKGTTGAGKTRTLPSRFDPLSGMRIHRAPGGGEVILDDLF